MFSSRFFLRASGAALALGAIAACSSATPESSESSSEAYVLKQRCPPGYSWVTDIGAYGKTIGSCELDPPPEGDAPLPTPASIFTAASNGDPSLGDSCVVNDPYAPPTNLQALGCTRGILIDNAVVFACPATATIPQQRIGLVNQSLVPQGNCYDSTGWQNVNLDYTVAGGCEATLLVKAPGPDGNATFHSKCLGSPLPGWQLVVDAVMDVHKCFIGGLAWNPGNVPPGPLNATYIAPDISILPSSSCNSGCIPVSQPPCMQ
jgi:hypothetical protein